MAKLAGAEWPGAGFEITTPESPTCLCRVYGDTPDDMDEMQVEARVAGLLVEAMHSLIQ